MVELCPLNVGLPEVAWGNSVLSHCSGGLLWVVHGEVIQSWDAARQPKISGAGQNYLQSN